MKMSLNSRLYIGFTIAFVLSAALGIISYLTFKRQTGESAWVKHTYKVINKAQEIQSEVVDMETGRRGFRSTNEKSFLEPYNTGIAHIQPDLTDLKNMVSDNPDEVNRVNDLQKKVDKLIQFWRNNGNDATLYDKKILINITADEKRQMDDIRDIINDILQAENKLLLLREQDNAQSVNFASWASSVGTIVVQIIILVLIYVTFSEFKNRRKAETALQGNLEQLEKLNKETNDKNWLLTGLSDVNTSLQGINNVSALAQLVLESILQYLELPAGAVYVYDEESKRLTMQASKALPADTEVSYTIGEGIVGTAGKIHGITRIKNVPANYWNIQSGSGKANPGEIVLVPLWYNNDLKGIIELASFGQFSDLNLELIQSTVNNIAVAVNAADARERIIRLLEQVQQQKESLQQQEEELRQSNEELTQQAEILQASEEELKVQEEELRQINAELEEKNEAIEVARQALSTKATELEVTSKYKSEFLANMSHELRTPLNSVLILAKLLAENKQQNLSDKQVEYANVIHKSGHDLLNLINDILDLSKIEAGKIDFTFEEVEVKNIINDIRLLFTVVAEEKSIRFDTQVNANVPIHVNTDKLRLEQIIKNLLSNAFKFTPNGGRVALSFNLTQPPANLYNENLKSAEKILAVSVTDTGIGIPREKQQLIFEAFQQADGSTSRKYGGTGLGLSISKELVKKLGGELKLESEEGKGSTFTIYLPLDTKSLQAAIEASSTLLPEPIIITNGITEQTTLPDDRANLQRNDKIMLIIEDDVNFAGILQDFAHNKNYKTVIALQGDEGLLYARRYKPSAIILDMQLPVLSGGQLLKIFKSEEALKNIPVHIISASDEAMMAAPGAIAYLKKPVEKDKLEKAFSLIGSHVNGGAIKRALVLSGDYLTDDSLKRIIEERHFDMRCDYTTSEAEALQKLKTQKYDCVIADIGKNISKGVEKLQHLKNAVEQDKTPIIIYMDKDLSTADELQLKKVSNIVIRNSSQAKDRLMDELELFLYKVQEVEKSTLPRRQAIITDDKMLSGKKVLLADDDVRNVFALNTLLEEQNMNVITADDGKEALKQINEHPDVNIVLMDVMMPEMDGYEAIRRIRADQRFAKLPVIALTAKAMQGDKEKAIEAGASDYITKPVDNNRLLSLMRVWLSQ